MDYAVYGPLYIYVWYKYKARFRFLVGGEEEPPWTKIDVFRGSCVAVWYDGGRYCVVVQ